MAAVTVTRVAVWPLFRSGVAAIPGVLVRARMGGCGQYATVKRAWMKDSFSRVSMTAAA
jgi:hypothetical protein